MSQIQRDYSYNGRGKILHALFRQGGMNSDWRPQPDWGANGRDPRWKRVGLGALSIIFLALLFEALLSKGHGADILDIQGSVLDQRHYEPIDGYKFRLGCQSSQEESWTNQPTALCCRTRQCLMAQEEGLPIDPIGLAREVLYFTMPRDNEDTTLVRQPLHIGRNEVTFLGGTFITTETLPYSAFGQKTDSLTYWWDSSSPWVPRVAFPRIDFDYPATSRAAFVPEVCRLGISLQWELP